MSIRDAFRTMAARGKDQPEGEPKREWLSLDYKKGVDLSGFAPGEVTLFHGVEWTVDRVQETVSGGSVILTRGFYGDPV